MMQTVRILTVDGFVDRTAKPVGITGYEGYHFFGIRQVDPAKDPDREYASPPMMWCVYEASSGRSVAWGDTLDKAAASAKQMLDSFGREWLEGRLASVAPVDNTLFGGL